MRGTQTAVCQSLRVYVRACVRAFWDGILLSTSIQYNELQGIVNKTEQRSTFTLQPIIHPHSRETQK